jgi:hypothetical protein
VVVSVEESQRIKSGEVWTRKTNEAESLLKHRKALMTSKPQLFVGRRDESTSNLITEWVVSGVLEA